MVMKVDTFFRFFFPCEETVVPRENLQRFGSGLTHFNNPTPIAWIDSANVFIQ
jgi:hypothetical protein